MTAPKIGFHASHEQFPPGELLDLVGLAEARGFRSGMSSDHLLPWTTAQRGGVGFAWSWLGAALARTSSMSFGVVTAPGQRHHPTMLAQAALTLTGMFPGRFWMAVGSGEALNEHVTGDRWPVKAERNERLRESVEVMRALWRGETVSHAGRVRVDRARVRVAGATPPPVLGAAVSPATAGWMAEWVDGLVTVNQPVDALSDVVRAFRENGGEGKPLRLQVHHAWAPSEEEALTQAHDQWRYSVLGGELAWNLEMPEQFDEATRHVRPEDVRSNVVVGADPDLHVEALREFAALGFDELVLHGVGPDQRSFVETFGDRVLPALR